MQTTKSTRNQIISKAFKELRDNLKKATEDPNQLNSTPLLQNKCRYTENSSSSQQTNNYEKKSSNSKQDLEKNSLQTSLISEKPSLYPQINNSKKRAKMSKENKKHKPLSMEKNH
jgi:hypothetical protein